MRGSSWPKGDRARSDRARPGAKHNVLTDRVGIPLSACLRCGNRDDVTQLEPFVEVTRLSAGRGSE
ncbi:hypothetical protein GCM10023170_007370 [Phytohabitans houttuyneae]|uniref:Uncharacterized protein n=1 Tax=Phytohabitans houttuyneae TaxID=1076126 RepID=A0A6V8K1W5_9ACTN|nr:hypothetical protein Phou_032930 [Phytohabitans houttuyneae]